MAQKVNGKDKGLKVHKQILKGIGRNVLHNISKPMAIDAEQSSGNIVQKVARFCMLS